MYKEAEWVRVRGTDLAAAAAGADVRIVKVPAAAPLVSTVRVTTPSYRWHGAPDVPPFSTAVVTAISTSASKNPMLPGPVQVFISGFAAMLSLTHAGSRRSW